jgi:DNA-directed RNA polymerase specialized sigma24 family protein
MATILTMAGGYVRSGAAVGLVQARWSRGATISHTFEGRCRTKGDEEALFSVTEIRRTEERVLTTPVLAFTAFVERHERPLREALTAAFGIELGRDVAADAFAHAWERWDRVSVMGNPTGYLYVVGRNQARKTLQRNKRRPVTYPTAPTGSGPAFEPALAGELANLSERERCVVLLLHGFEWTMSEVADTLAISKSTVQSYAERALTKLRSGMGVEQ